MRISSLILSFLLFSASAFAGLQPAKDFIHGLIELAEIQRSGQTAANPAVQEKITKLSSMVNFNVLAQKAMTKHWSKLSEAQRKDFMKTLQGLLEEVAYPNAKKIKTDSAQLAFATAGSAQKIKVTGKIERMKKGEIISSDLEVILHFAAGKIVDAVLEGELLSQNLKRQFDKALEKQTFDQILTKMKDRLASARTKQSK